MFSNQNFSCCHYNQCVKFGHSKVAHKITRTHASCYVSQHAYRSNRVWEYMQKEIWETYNKYRLNFRF